MGGFFGVVSHRQCINDLFYGTDYHSHLGTKRAGLATYGKETGFSRAIHNIESTYFRTKFEEEIPKFPGESGIGVISDTDPQPVYFHSHLGKFCLVCVAKINNMEELTNEILHEGGHFAETNSCGVNPTEIIASIVSRGKTFAEGIRLVHMKVKGSCSLLIMTEQGIIAARDFWGRTPIAIGRKSEGYALASESSAFPNLDYEHVRDLGPGEAVKVTAEGVEPLLAPQENMQICSFLWVYYGFPTSTYEGVNVEQMRFDNGLLQGQEDKVDVDCTCGIPDSGTGFAFGYAAGKHLPYLRGVSKYTATWPRSFTPSTQDRRALVAKMKLIPNKEILKGKRFVFCDDSIVRGTQLRDNVKMLYDCGVKEAHVRISCPPIIHACPFLNFTSERSPLELIARRIILELEGDDSAHLDEYSTPGTERYKKLVEKIRVQLGLTSLEFNSIEMLVKAIGLPKCKLCTHCFDGSSHF